VNDQEELQKYTRRDFAAWAASAGLLTALPSVANAVAVAEREVAITTADGTCDAYFVAPTAPQGGKTPIAEVMPLMQALTPAMHLSDGKAFVAWLDAQPEVDKARKIGTTGYCMGGPIAVRTASVAPGRVGAVGTFHGAAMVTPAPDSPHRLIAQTKAQYLIAVAGNDDQHDPQAKVALREALAAAKLPGEVEVYPAAHGWCPPDTQVYDAAQSERAWARLLANFKQALG